MKKSLKIMMLLLSINMYAQQKNCAQFRTGEFRYLGENMPEIIIRNDTLQIETNPINKVEIHSSIKWTSDCDYVMTYEKILNYHEDVSDVIGKKIYVSILETEGKKYKVRAKGVFLDSELVFEKIN